MKLDQINVLMKDLPKAALSLMPDDSALIFLTGSLPTEVTYANMKTTMTILSLIARRIAVVFDQLAVEYEQLISSSVVESER